MVDIELIFEEPAREITFETPEYILQFDADKGIPGPTGADGREIQLRVTATHLQQRYEGETDWTNVIPLVDILQAAAPNLPGPYDSNQAALNAGLTAGQLYKPGQNHEAGYLPTYYFVI